MGRGQKIGIFVSRLRRPANVGPPVAPAAGGPCRDTLRCGQLRGCIFGPRSGVAWAGLKLYVGLIPVWTSKCSSRRYNLTCCDVFGNQERSRSEDALLQCSTVLCLLLWHTRVCVQNRYWKKSEAPTSEKPASTSVYRKLLLTSR